MRESEGCEVERAGEERNRERAAGQGAGQGAGGARALPSAAAAEAAEAWSREQGKGMHLSTDAYRSYVLRFWGGPPSTRGGVAFAISLGCILMAQAAHP